MKIILSSSTDFKKYTWGYEVNYKYTFNTIKHNSFSMLFRTDLEKFSITSLAHQWILCSEWVPSEWESKQLIKTLQ